MYPMVVRAYTCTSTFMTLLKKYVYIDDLNNNTNNNQKVLKHVRC